MTASPLAALALAALTGCTLITDSFATNDFSGDTFPIDVDTTSGAVVVGVRPAGGPDLVAVLDVLSPLTLIDPGPGRDEAVTSADLTLLGRGPSGLLDLPRAQLAGAQVISLHPCRDDTCVVGPEGAARPYDAVIGANVLAGDAVRLRLGDDRVFVLADIGGTDRERAFACDAVFPSPYRGGGTLVIAGTELSFGGRRVTLQTCLGDDPDPAKPQSRRGADALLVASTGSGRTLLSASAYERFRASDGAAPPLDQLPAETVFLPAGPATGRRAVIPRLALVAASSSAPRAPCRQVYAHHLLSDLGACEDGLDCPCENGARFCAVPALIQLSPQDGIAVLVVADDNPTLQALRTELRPDQPEVDGILGSDAIRSAELDIDYPHARVLARCAGDPCACSARPALPDTDDLDDVRACAAAQVCQPAPPATPRAR